MISKLAVLLASAFALLGVVPSKDWKHSTLEGKEFLLKDLRLTMLSAEEATAMTSTSKIRVIWGKTKVQFDDVELGEVVEFEKRFANSSSVPDCRVILFQRNSIQVRPPWYFNDKTAELERKAVDKSKLVPGDVVWILPRDGI